MKKLLFIIVLLAGNITSSFAYQAQPTTPATDSVKAATLAKTKKDSLISANKKQVNAKTDTTTTAVIAKCATSTGGFATWVGWGLILLIICVFFGLARWSDLLRNAIMDPVTFVALAQNTKYRNVTNMNKIPKPFSLSRSQLGVWTVIIGCSYVYLELCKYAEFPGISVDKTLLGLMGISAITAAAGNVIDNNMAPDQQGLVRPSEGFFKDILSDQNGINIHRLQNVIWMLIAATLYLCQVPDVPCGHLPTLDTTLLALTGLSNATYIGLKVNENKPPALPKPPAT